MTVIPSGPDQVDQAVDAMARREGWYNLVPGSGSPRELPGLAVRLLEDWFDAGWSADAILVALRRTPDDRWVPPRRDGEDDLHEFLRKRLKAWYDDRPDADGVLARRPPPRPGQSLEHWQRVNSRNRELNRVRPRQPLTRQGQAARDQALRETRQRHDPQDRIKRVRDSQARIDAAMDRLGAPSASDALQYVARPARQHGFALPASRLPAAFAGRQALLGSHKRVVEIVERLAVGRRGPTAAERQLLRNAIHDTRAQAALAQLEAWTAVHGGQNLLSDAGFRMLEYLQSAVAEDLSFDMMVTTITSIAESAA